MVCVPVRSIILSLKLGDSLSIQVHKPCSISHLFSGDLSDNVQVPPNFCLVFLLSYPENFSKASITLLFTSSYLAFSTLGYGVRLSNGTSWLNCSITWSSLRINRGFNLGHGKLKQMGETFKLFSLIIPNAS